MAVYLTPASPEDIPLLELAYQQSEGLHQPWAYAPKDFHAHVAQTHLYLINHKVEPGLLGSINISNIVRGHFQSAYLGYLMFVPFNGKGYMQEALDLAIDIAFKELNLHRLEANIQPGNLASIALVKKAGFVLEGYSKNYLCIGGKQWMDHERWAMINEVWQPQF